ncbi:mechanosensitive ion channel [Candidatus Woesearchaeota archaeon]|nr:mechanosensitive ion channel [Candidatus Woesearchaeota archaeon]
MAFFSTLQSIIIDLVVAVLIIFLGLVIARFLGNLTRRILKEFETDRIIKDYSFLTLKIEDLMGNLVKYLIYLITAVIALNQIGITGIVIYILIGLGILTAVGIVLFDVKDYMRNLVIGIFSKKRKKFRLNQEVRINCVKGRIIDLGITEIKIKTKKEDILVIPSSLW